MVNSKNNYPWTDEIEEELRERWSQNWTATSLMVFFTKKYGIPVTKGMIMGKVWRLNLQKNPGVVDNRTQLSGMKVTALLPHMEKRAEIAAPHVSEESRTATEEALEKHRQREREKDRIRTAARRARQKAENPVPESAIHLVPPEPEHPEEINIPAPIAKKTTAALLREILQNRKQITDATIVEAAPLPKSEIAEMPRTAKPWTDAKYSECKWPVGGDGDSTYFCCAPRNTDIRYCDEHAKIAYYKNPGRRPMRPLKAFNKRMA